MAAAERLDKAASAFPVSVGLDGVVAHQAWREARARVLGLLAGGGGRLIALVGPAGTGKTLLLREVARTLRAEGRQVTLVDRPDLDASTFPSPAEGTPARERAGVLLVDEAGRMDGDALEGLSRSGTACVLAGLPGLAERLERRGIAAAIVDLPPLDVDEVARFVAARLAAAGRRRDLLSPGAILELAAQSGGIPRLVNMLAGPAIFLASLEGAREVDGRHVLDAASLRAGEQVDAQTPAGAAPTSAARDESAQVPQVQAASAPVARRPSPVAGEPEAAADAGIPLAPGQDEPREEGTSAFVASIATSGDGVAASAAPTASNRAGASSAADLARMRPSILSLPGRRVPTVWIAGAFCLVAAGLWLLPVPSHRALAPADERASASLLPSPAPTADVLPAPAQPAPGDPPPAGAPVPQAAPQVPSRARGEDPAARPLPGPPRTRPEAPAAALPAPVPPEVADVPIVPAPPRVVLHAQPGPALTEAGRMATALEREFGTIELRTVPSSPRTPTVRYFYAEDATTARRLAGALPGVGEGWRVQYLGTFRPLPRRGTIEVWVP